MSATENTLDHLHLLFFSELGLCGCGDLYAAASLVRSVLGLAPYDVMSHAKAVELIGTPGAVHLVLSVLDNAGLTEHGSMVDCAWLTDKGCWFQQALATVESWDELDEGGLPHDTEPCTDACWQMPVT